MPILVAPRKAVLKSVSRSLSRAISGLSTRRSFGCGEAAQVHQIFEVTKSDRGFLTDLATLLGLASVDVLR